MERLAESGGEWGRFHLRSLEALLDVYYEVNNIVYDILSTHPYN